MKRSAIALGLAGAVAVSASVLAQSPADLVAARREGPLPIQVGGRRRARLRQPPEGGRRHEGRGHDQDRRGDRAGPRAQRQDAVLRHAPLRRARQAHVPQPARQQARLQRGAGGVRDRPGRHPARRLRPPEPRGQPLQLLQDQRDLGARRLQQARHPPARHVLRARRADRRRRLQGRGDAARYLRDHGGGPGGRAQEAGHHPAGRRRHPRQHRLEQAVGQGQRALRQVVSRHRHQGGAMADRQGPAAARLRQLAGRGGAQSRPADLAARAPAGPGGQRRAPARRTSSSTSWRKSRSTSSPS